MISIERAQEAIKASSACKDRSPEVILELMTDRESFQYLVLHAPELLTVLYSLIQDEGIQRELELETSKILSLALRPIAETIKNNRRNYYHE